MKHRFVLKISGILLFLLSAVLCFYGCNTEGPQIIEWVKIESPERTSRCVVLDKNLQGKFSFENCHVKKLDRNRLKIIAEIRNRTDNSVVAEISTAFRDTADSVVDQTAWKEYVLPPNHTIAYEISSVAAAENFCVRLRSSNR